MKYSNLPEYVRRIKYRLKDLVYDKNIPFSLIRIFFIKYVTDNLIGLQTKEDLTIYTAASAVFVKSDNGTDANDFLMLLSHLDNVYHLDGLLAGSVARYNQDLFGIDDKSVKSNVTDGQFKRLRNEAAFLYLVGDERECETFTVGKEIVQNLLSEVYSVSESYAGQTGKYITQISLANLVACLLNVKDGDSFCDMASGIGVSTIKIAGNKKVGIHNFEASAEVAEIAAMLYIMYGFKNFQITVSDFKIECCECKEDKIFVDVTKLKTEICSNISVITEECLKDGGLAVFAVPSSFLIKLNNQNRSIREWLFNNGYVNSIIMLPPCWLGTGMPTNLLVLSKTHNKDVLFINASENTYRTFYKKDKVNCTLTQEGINEIVNIFTNRINEAGVSKIVTSLNNNYSFLPATYIDPQSKTVGQQQSIKEIDAELKILYSQFADMVKD